MCKETHDYCFICFLKSFGSAVFYKQRLVCKIMKVFRLFFPGFFYLKVERRDGHNTNHHFNFDVSKAASPEEQLAAGFLSNKVNH